MFSVLNLFRYRFLKDVINPKVLAVKGMLDNKKSVRESRVLVENWVIIKKAIVASTEMAKTRILMFLFPVRTARVLFCPFWSLSMSGAPRLRLRKKPYSIKGTDRLMKNWSSCPFTKMYPTLGIMKPVAPAIVNSPKPREHNLRGGAEYAQPRKFAPKVINRKVTGA